MSTRDSEIGNSSPAVQKSAADDNPVGRSLGWFMKPRSAGLARISGRSFRDRWRVTPTGEGDEVPKSQKRGETASNVVGAAGRSRFTGTSAFPYRVRW